MELKRIITRVTNRNRIRRRELKIEANAQIDIHCANVPFMALLVYVWIVLLGAFFIRQWYFLFILISRQLRFPPYSTCTYSIFIRKQKAQRQYDNKILWDAAKQSALTIRSICILYIVFYAACIWSACVNRQLKIIAWAFSLQWIPCDKETEAILNLFNSNESWH